LWLSRAPFYGRCLKEGYVAIAKGSGQYEPLKTKVTSPSWTSFAQKGERDFAI